MSTPAVNAQQAAAWNGNDGKDWTVFEDHFNAGLRRHTVRLFDAAEVRPGDCVLDIGCGCGETTRLAARAAVSGSALGVDLSARMLERARERSAAEGIGNVAFEEADAQVHRFEAATFDLAMSRTGVMFFDDPDAAWVNIRRALRPDGRLALVTWQALEHNEWMAELRAALSMGRTLPAPPMSAPGPFGLADPDFVRRLLRDAGFRDVELDDVQEPFYAGVDADDAFGFVSQTGMAAGMLGGLDGDTRARALDNLRATIAEHQTTDGVLFGSGAWLITATVTSS
jgi:SAM-dependent methyltransferase